MTGKMLVKKQCHPEERSDEAIRSPKLSHLYVKSYDPPPGGQEGGERVKRILIVEDDGVLRRELATLLEASGYAVRQIDDFSDALSQMERAGADLILLDIQLPQVNGEMLLQAFRRRISSFDRGQGAFHGINCKYSFHSSFPFFRTS